MDQHTNFGYSAVDVAPSPALSGTTLNVTAGTGALFPAAPFNCTVWPTGAQPFATNAEIIRVTSKGTGDNWTIVRTSETGGVNRAIVVGDQIAATITVKTLTDVETALVGLISGVNVSAGATSNNLSAITFSNANGVTFGLSASTLTASVATNYQSQGAYLTTAALSQDSSKYAGTNGAITGGSITVNTSGVSVNLPAYLTTAMQSDAVTLSNIKVSAGASSALLSALTLSNSNGLAFGLNAGTITGSYTVPAAQTAISGIAGSNTTYTSGTVQFSGVGGGITVSSNTGQRIDLSVAAPVAQTVQTQNLVAVSLSGNTAGALALVSSGTVIFAGGNNITLSQNGQSITISGANAGGAQTGISGIIVSDATYTSGTVSFSNAGNITIASSVNGATQFIRLSGNAAQTTQSAIKALGVSNTGNTAGNTGLSTGVDWVIAGSNGITASQSTAGGGPNTIWISGVTTAAQTNQSAIKGFGVSNTGQTAGNTGISTGIDWVLAGSGSITLSQSTAGGGPNTVWMQHPAWLTTAMASNRGSDFVQATAVFNGTNASGTIASVAISVSVAAPVPIGTAVKAVASVGSTGTITRYAPEDHQHAGVAAFAVTNTGNTAGNTRSQVGTFYIAATGAITASQSTAAAGNDTVWLSVAAQTNQSAIKGFGASNTGNTAGNTGLSTGIDWVLAGSNNVTISQSTTAGGPNTLWVSGPTVGGAQTGISSIIVSDATYTSGMVSFSNQANITIGSSVNGATQFIRLSGNAAQTTQSAIKGLGVSNTGNTAGNTGLSTGIDWVVAGSNGITASQSTSAGGPNTIWISGVTTAAQTNQSAIKGFGVSNTGQTAGNTGLSTGIDWVLAGSGSITLSQSTAVGGPNTVWVQHPAWITGATQSSLSISDAATSGTLARLAFTNLNGITLSLSSGAGGSHTIVGSYTVPTVTNSSWSVSDAATSGTVGRLAFTNLNGVTLSLSTGAAGSHTIVGSHNALTSQSTQFMALTLGGNTAGTTTFHATNNASLFFNAGNNITFSGNGSTVTIIGASAAPSPVVISAGANSASLASIVFSDSNGISFGLNGSTITGTVNTYDTVGTATTVKAVASANSVGTVTRWAAEDHAHAGIGGFGISTAGNTSGTTGSQVGTYWMQGGNNITLSQITSNNGSHTLIVSAGPDPGTISMWPDVLPGSTAVSTYYSGSTSQGAGGGSSQTGYTFSIYVVPMPLQAAVAFSELRIGVSNTRSAASTGSVTHLYSVGIYSNNASTLSLVKGYYGGLYLTQNSVTAQTFSLFTLSTGSNSAGGNGGFAGLQAVSVYSSAGNISANSQMDGAPGVKFIRVDNGVATTLTEGQYFIALAHASVSSAGNIYACVGVLQSNAISSVNIPDLGRENSTQSSNYLPGWGAISTTFTSQSNAATFFPLPNAIALTNMSRSSSAWFRFHFPLMRNLS